MAASVSLPLTLMYINSEPALYANLTELTRETKRCTSDNSCTKFCDTTDAILNLVNESPAGLHGFATGAWYMKNICSDEVKAGLSSSSNAGWETFVTSCLGTNLTDQHRAYWERAKNAFGSQHSKSQHGELVRKQDAQIEDPNPTQIVDGQPTDSQSAAATTDIIPPYPTPGWFPVALPPGKGPDPKSKRDMPVVRSAKFSKRHDGDYMSWDEVAGTNLQPIQDSNVQPSEHHPASIPSHQH